jgi:hypothetical protein
MNHKQRIEAFQLIRLKLGEIEEIMEVYGGKKQYLSMYCFGIFVPESDQDEEKYEMMTGMHMATPDEYDLMIETVDEVFETHINDEEDEGDSSTIDYWLNK